MSGSTPTIVDLAWEGELRFAAHSGEAALLLDSSGKAGPSPVQALAASLGGCMAMDVALILNKARLPMRGLRAHLVAERAGEEPRRILGVDLRFEVEGDVPDDKVERAIALSKEKYCSVWHSLNPDIDLKTSFVVKR